MSNFLRRGKRVKARAEKKELKKRIKEFYKIIGKIDDTVNIIKDEGLEVNEDNVEEVASVLMGRPIDNMEKLMILGKLGRNEN